MNNIGIIAGGGKLPIIIGDNLIKRKYNIFFFVIEEFFNTNQYNNFDVTIINLNSAKKIIHSLKSRNINSIIMAGNINRPSLTDLSFDYETFKLAKNLLLNKTGDDGLLVSLKKYFNDNGFSYFDWKNHCPELFANKDLLTQIKPSTKAKQNFGELGAVWSMKNGYSGYLVKDPEDWIQLKGPVGLAIRLCGCESFNQVVETEATKEFGHHFSNIFYFTLKEIEELPAQYRENLKAMLLTTIDSIYHVEEWSLDKADGILTQAIGALLRYEFGLDFNAYITENQVPVCYDGEDLASFGVSGVSDIEYPVDYIQMEADLLALVM